MNAHSHRTTRIRLALGALLAAAALCIAPRLAQQVYAQDDPRPTCTANCSKGSCSGTGNCTCTCSFWGGTPSCSCSGPPAIQ